MRPSPLVVETCFRRRVRRGTPRNKRRRATARAEIERVIGRVLLRTQRVKCE
jgi:hypothetical protein